MSEITCRLCKEEELIEVMDYELFNPETDQYDLVSGFLCPNCDCFHGLEMDWFQYTASGPNLTKNCFK